MSSVQKNIGPVPAPPPANEAERQRALDQYRVLDTIPESVYDDLVFIASEICQTPIALMSLIDRDRQWFKARVGLDAEQTPRDLAFCAHAILEPDQLFEIGDATQDTRFSGNPLVTGDPSIRFYAGVPLVTPDGLAIGTLCTIDRRPRELTQGQQRAMRALSREIMVQLELRRSVMTLESDLASLRAQPASAPRTPALNDTEERIRALLGRMQQLQKRGSPRTIG